MPDDQTDVWPATPPTIGSREVAAEILAWLAGAAAETDHRPTVSLVAMATT
jgi:hypothetical protein